MCKERDGQTSLALVSKPIVVHEKNIFLSKLVYTYLQEAYVLFLQSPHFTFLIWAGYYAIALCVFSSQRRVNPMSHWTPEAGLAAGRGAAPAGPCGSSGHGAAPAPATGHRAQGTGCWGGSGCAAPRCRQRGPRPVRPAPGDRRALSPLPVCPGAAARVPFDHET